MIDRCLSQWTRGNQRLLDTSDDAEIELNLFVDFACSPCTASSAGTSSASFTMCRGSVSSEDRKIILDLIILEKLLF